MEKVHFNRDIEKKELGFIFMPLLLLLPILFYSEQLYGVFKDEHYIYFHLAIQILVIVFAMAIAIQTWLIFPHLKFERTLYTGVFFFTIALFEWINIIEVHSFVSDYGLQTSYLSMWLHLIIRLLLAGVFLVIIMKNQTQLQLNQRLLTYGKACILSIFTLIILSNPPVFLQPFIVEEIQQPQWQNVLQLSATGIQLIVLVILMKNYHLAPKRAGWLAIASLYLIVSDVLFTVYQDPYAFGHVLALGYKIYAFFFVIKAIYFGFVERPYQQLLQIQKNLEQSEKELYHQVYHDDVTQLANERFLLKTLKVDLQTGNEPKAVIAIEIDRLATIRSSLGISYSNKMLKLVADRIISVLPVHFFAAKLQEDQFVIYIGQFKAKEELILFCETLKGVMLKDPVQIQHYSLNGDLNIGIAIQTEEYISEETLLMQARLAMKEASRFPKRLLFYKPSMSDGVADRLLLEQELRQALANNEFHLVYQPQVNLKSGKIESVEALVRWQHPTRGSVSPCVFIPIAEESGLIIQLGEWVLEAACLQAKEWQKQGLPNMKVAVNLSLGQLFQKNLVNMVEDILLRTKLNPCYLQLEITESMAMNIDEMTLLLRELKSLGIQIAVDDFGTGYSSLSYLKDFPIDCIKIDRAFVRNIQHDKNDEVLVSMILSMAKHLCLKVVAEGIEDIEQLSFLLEGECDYIQGYLFSKPIAAKQLEKTIDELHLHAENILNSFKSVEEYSI
ncbi:putative bifunctional diguanylate cyclase/phosphodiesterase [Lysinibacillus sp. NPDC096418]|uniref:putative bifunctional diguanylate cyclase/phosphodiesterase n=1 Tax=Lysinibacillus sp. NPDC096418 TaxID=3364138 RepID=UPI00381E34C9